MPLASPRSTRHETLGAEYRRGGWHKETSRGGFCRKRRSTGRICGNHTARGRRGWCWRCRNRRRSGRHKIGLGAKGPPRGVRSASSLPKVHIAPIAQKWQLGKKYLLKHYAHWGRIVKLIQGQVPWRATEVAK